MAHEDISSPLEAGPAPEGDPTEVRALALRHLDACRIRAPGFIDAHYSLRGAFHLNRLAWGRDMLVAPVNFLMVVPNFLVRLLAIFFEACGARRPARWLLGLHLGLRTRVQSRLRRDLERELLDLDAAEPETPDLVRDRVREAARDPVSVYLNTRSVAGDITAGTAAAFFGLVVFHQFTPGSVSAGAAVAHRIATEQAVADFMFGEFLGRAWYSAFPVEPSAGMVVYSVLATILVLAVFSAFSGMIHDPVQRWLGIHGRRVRGLLDAIEESLCSERPRGFRPRDTFVGRIYDVLDWIKGLFSF